MVLTTESGRLALTQIKSYISHTFCASRKWCSRKRQTAELKRWDDLSYKASGCLVRSMLLKMKYRHKCVYHTSTPKRRLPQSIKCWGFCQPLTETPWRKRQAYNCQCLENWGEMDLFGKTGTVQGHIRLCSTQIVHNSQCVSPTLTPVWLWELMPTKRWFQKRSVQQLHVFRLVCWPDVCSYTAKKDF